MIYYSFYSLRHFNQHYFISISAINLSKRVLIVNIQTPSVPSILRPSSQIESNFSFGKSSIFSKIEKIASFEYG